MTPNKFQHAGLDWIPHTPGDPMPCPPNTLVRVLFADMDPSTSGTPACRLNWGCNNNAADIIGWHPIEEDPLRPVDPECDGPCIVCGGEEPCSHNFDSISWPKAYTTSETSTLRRVLGLLEAGDIEQAEQELREELG